MVWVEEHDKRSFLLDLMDAAGLGAKDLDGEVSYLPPIHLDLDDLYCMRGLTNAMAWRHQFKCCLFYYYWTTPIGFEQWFWR